MCSVIRDRGSVPYVCTLGRSTASNVRGGDGLRLGVLKAGELSCVPEASDLAVSGGHRLRDPIGNAMVKAQAERHASRNCEWHVIPRHVDFLEAVVFLEVGQTVMLFLTIREVCVPEI